VGPSLRRLQARHWGLVAVAGSIAAITGRPGVGGVLIGGALIGLSILVYAAGMRVLVCRAGPRLAIALLFVKLAAFLGLGWLVLASGREHRPDAIGFAVGLTCLPVAAVWEALRARGTS